MKEIKPLVQEERLEKAGQWEVHDFIPVKSKYTILNDPKKSLAQCNTEVATA